KGCPFGISHRRESNMEAPSRICATMTRIYIWATLVAAAAFTPALADTGLPPAAPSALVEYREFDRVAAAEGVIEAVRQSTLAAQVAGRVVALNVKAGDSVRAGQVLMQIDARSAAQ